MSKRTMDTQGGADRYGGPDGLETPDDTPQKANAAQLARRKIAPVRGRTARAKSPIKTGPLFGGFNQGQQDTMAQPTQNGFSFGQSTSSASTNGFAFGQSQQAGANGGFAFGQSQPAGSTSFTFGQNSGTPSNGFNFNAPTSSVSFPPASGSNPFSTTNGTGAPGVNGGFQGSIFSIPPSNASPTSSQGMSNGFSFTSNHGSTAPSSPGQASPDKEAEKRDIKEREPYLDPGQQQQLERIVSSHLLNSPNLYQQDPLDMLPPSVLSEAAKFVRSLPVPRPHATKNVMSLFVKPYRGKSQQQWVTDSDRREFQTIATKLAADQQTQLAQYVKDKVEPLRSAANAALPGLEHLPNDVQYEMLRLARRLTQQDQDSGAPTNSNTTSPPETNGEDQPHIEESGNTPAKPNPFAAIKKSPAPPTNGQTQPPKFSFGSQTSTPGQQPKPSSAPVFSFSKPTFSSPGPTPQQESGASPAMSNPFASLSHSKTAAPAPAPGTSVERSKPTTNGTGQSAPVFSASPFKFAQPAQPAPPAEKSTPAKTQFSFSQTAQTPAPPSSNIFNLGSTGPPPPATAPVQKTLPAFTFSGVQNGPAKPTFAALQSATETQPSSPVQQLQQATSTKSQRPTESRPEAGKNESRLRALVTRMGYLNASFRETMAGWSPYTDWAPAMRFYLKELDELKRLIKEDETATSEGLHSTTGPLRPASLLPSDTAAPAAPTNNPANLQEGSSKGTSPQHSSAALHPASHAPQNSPSDSPAKTSTSTARFQLPSPQKPLSTTASIFSSILDAPDKSAEARSPPKPAPQPAATVFSPFKVQAPTTGTSNTGFATHTSTTDTPPSGPVAPASIAAAAASSKQPTSAGIPKFGGGTSTNFMSAFGVQATKQAAKDRAKRKAEDFDSDEDDEAEWERQDREKQEEKRRKLAQQANKVMKNVDGKFVWVDADADSEEPTPVDSEAVTESAKQPPATPAKAGNGLFSRIAKNDDGSLQREQQDNSDEATAESGVDSPSGDNTWKPETPIKFAAIPDTPKSTTPTGSPAKPLFNFTKTNGTERESSVSATPKFTFGKPSNEEKTPSTSIFANTPKPLQTPKFTFPGSTTNPGTSIFSTVTGTGAASSGNNLFANLSKTPSATPAAAPVAFKFGGPATAEVPTLNPASVFASPSTSRATTPGLTGDEASTGANTDAEDGPVAGDAAPPEEQRDLTSLSDEERRTEDVLFEGKTRCRKFNRGAAEPWENRGVGVVRLLKNKESGNHRVLMRLSPGGQLVINANVLKQQGMYTALNPKVLKAAFAEGEGALSTYSLTFGKKEACEELLGMLQKVTEQ